MPEKKMFQYSIRRILVVDDEIEFAKTLGRHLRREGFNLDSASNGSIACKKMDQVAGDNSSYDLVITDVIMPDMDGISLLEWIKKVHPRTSVVVLTAFGNLTQIKERIRAHMDVIGQKPLTPSIMMRLIRDIQEKRSQWLGQT